MPGPDGRPTASVVGAAGRLGWPLWAAYIAVFALTVLVGVRLTVALARVAIANRRRRAHHRMVVDLVGVGHDAALAQPCAKTRDLRSWTSRNRWPTACRACVAGSWSAKEH